MTSFVIFRY